MQKSKGYYRALCACLCLLAAGGATAYYGLSKISQKPQTQNAQQKPVQSAVVKTQTAQPPVAEQVIITQSPPLEEAKVKRQEETAQSAKATVVEEKKAPQTTPDKAAEIKTEPVFTTPLTGEIVMDYSMEHAIYDPTLEQFRTNNCISIGAAQGDGVVAAEEGTVANVVEHVERGITVVINHNNGWETTYSQLAENVSVKKGEQVEKGQKIGIVAKPTKYGATLGDHVDFAVIKDGAYVDPKGVLAQ